MSGERQWFRPVGRLADEPAKEDDVCQQSKPFGSEVNRAVVERTDGVDPAGLNCGPIEPFPFGG